MEADLKRIKSQLKEASDKNKMQIEQINACYLRGESPGRQHRCRERMLAREPTSGTFYNAHLGKNDVLIWFSDLKRVIAGKDLPETSSLNLSLFTKNWRVEGAVQESQDKLSKAKRYV